MARDLERQFRVTGVPDDDAWDVVPFGGDGVTGTGDCGSQHVEPWPHVADAAGGVGGGPREKGHVVASFRTSLTTPAAVTCGPAPGPVMTNGFSR